MADDADPTEDRAVDSWCRDLIERLRDAAQDVGEG
jgi:hypothetical protein